MGFDLMQSRNTYNEHCKWWARNEADMYTSDELIMNRVPSGHFQAKEINPELKQNRIVGNTFMFDRTNITIKSPDNLENIKNNDLILFRGEKWIVSSVQKTKARAQRTFFALDKNVSHYWYLELRK